MQRKNDLRRFYQLLQQLEEKKGSKRELGDCTGRMDWPERGMYFFFSSQETISNPKQRRVTRVGAHAVTEGSQTELWDRLRQHRGTVSGDYPDGGNHRGSVSRLRVGEALIEKHNEQDKYPHWGEGSTYEPEMKEKEHPMEKRVSHYIRDLPFLWLEVEGEPDKHNDRAHLERNAIALLSNYEKQPIHSRDEDWLGKHSRSEKISASGLWNINHVDEHYDPDFLQLLGQKI